MRAGKIRVVTTLFVLYDFAKAVGGDHAEVRMLIPPGIEPHGFEPTPGDMVRIQKGDLFIYTGRAMERWVDSLLVAPDMQKTTVVEAARSIGIDAGAKGHANDEERHRDGQDPHVWLDLSNAQKMVDTIRDEFIEKDSPHREQYRANADAYKAQLAALDERFRAVLSSCKKKVVIYGGHAAFSYLANRYGLRFVAAYRGFSPDAEPTPRRIAEMADKMKRYGLGHVFYEELVSPRGAVAVRGKERFEGYDFLVHLSDVVCSQKGVDPVDHTVHESREVVDLSHFLFIRSAKENGSDRVGHASSQYIMRRKVVHSGFPLLVDLLAVLLQGNGLRLQHLNEMSALPIRSPELKRLAVMRLSGGMPLSLKWMTFPIRRSA